MVNQSLSFSLFILTRVITACISSLTRASQASPSLGPARVRSKGICWTTCLSITGAAGGAAGCVCGGAAAAVSSGVVLEAGAPGRGCGVVVLATSMEAAEPEGA